MRLGVAQYLRLAALTLVASACHLCEYRDYTGSATFDVALDEQCPPRTFGPTDPPDNEGLVSIDGPPTRVVVRSASEKCCYNGHFVHENAEFSGELCAFFDFVGRGDEQGFDHCPSRENLLASKTAKLIFARPQGSWGVDSSDLISLEAGPVSGDVSLRQDACVYPATYRTTADACG